jgi:serine protease
MEPMNATRSKWIPELAFFALAGCAMPALSADQVGIEFAGHVAVGRDSVALADCGSADGRHKILVEYSDFVPAEPGASGAKDCRASPERAFEFTQVKPEASGPKSILIDEPGVSRVTLPVPNPPNASCPGGFFIATVDDGPGASVSPGAFGMELLLDEPGTRVLAGGINFGGLVDSGQVGFAGFNFTNTANENQRFNISLRGSPGSNSAGTLQVRVKIMRSISATSSETVFDGTGDLTMSSSSVAQIVVPPGFYVATVEPRGVSAGAPGGTPEGQFFFELTTSFVDRPGGGFQGGVVVGGYHATHPFGGVSGFGAFCLPTPHSASVRVLSAPTYGAGGARDLRLRILDAAQAEVVAVPGTPKRLSGELIAVSDSYVDGDVNNPAVPNRDNDNAGQVQAIGNPAIVAGFAARTPTGQTTRGDRFASSTDPFDAYRVTVTANQTIQLVISDWSATAPTSTDLDLQVYAAGTSSTPLFTALGTDKNEFITIPTTGQYDVVVSAFAGFSNYVLAISNTPPPPATAAMLKLEDADIIPGEVIVRFDEPSPEDPRKAVLSEPDRSLKARATQLGLEAAQGEPGRPMLFRWSGSGQIHSALQKLGVGGLKSVEASGYGLSDEQRTRWEEIALIKALRASSEIRYAEPNRRVSLMALPNDPRNGQQWHYPLINLPQAWDITTGNPNVVVAVVDTGVAPHPDLEANVRRDLGRDLLGDSFIACDGDGADSNADDQEYLCVGQQKPISFHGTHVAGTIAAVTNNALGVAGVAGNAAIMPVRVFGRDGTPDGLSINKGILWAAGLTVDGFRSPRKADVINLSLGGPSACSSAQLEIIAAAISQGATVVASTGNSNTNVFAPANCAGVVAVAAVDRNGVPAAYSNGGPEVVLAAPGGQSYADNENSALFPPRNPFPAKPPLSGRFMSAADGVLSTVFVSQRNTGLRSVSYDFSIGTSMASPHAAGVIALMKSVYPALSQQQLASLIAAGRITRDDPAIPGIDNLTGYGIIDAFKAVSEARLLAGGGAAPPRITVTPTELDFGETATVLPIVVGATAAGVTVNSAVSSQPWLTVSGAGIGNYQAQVNRGTLPSGSYQGRVTITPSAGSPVTVNVRMRVGARVTTGDVSTIYLVLLDTEGEPLIGGDIPNQQGRYPFAISNVPAGSYYIVAGSDNDNDQIFCDAGESCAVYPSFANFGPIEMGSTDLNLGGFPIAPDTLGIGSNGTAAAALQDLDKSAAAARIGRGFTFRRTGVAKGMGE